MLYKVIYIYIYINIEIKQIRVLSYAQIFVLFAWYLLLLNLDYRIIYKIMLNF
jgi:hypothetical protein